MSEAAIARSSSTATIRRDLSDFYVAGAAKQEGVSIVIPNWNHRRFLTRSVQSARRAIACLGEIDVPAEVIVIDDSSRDGSQRFLSRLESLYNWGDVATVFLNENAGLCAVRNLGFQLARFRAVLFLDADNQLIAESVPTLYRAMVETGASLVYGNLLDVHRESIVAIRSNEVPTLRLSIDNYIDALALVDAPAALSVGGYTQDRSLDYWADYEFVLHLLAEELLLVFVPIPVAYYHHLPRSMMTLALPNRDTDRPRLARMYFQEGTREWDQKRVGRMYHPELGFLDDEW